ncbi:HAD-IA family hydrolase [Psychrobacter sanguinis]|uniref:HAD-IA family hydrolase n=1 Tax=Psychrobacter sanguinis TaxID=861445 RepID=A0A844M0S1_9GAMM|nr:HAD-IA family hydrolase [Psychrobacter sanguinis]MUG32561.1 HAD-IA family hydrolase [Psychrobacter sanguinis]
MVEDTCLVLTDLDGTLIDTDKANNLSYLKALKRYLPNIDFTNESRITRTTIEKYCSDKLLIKKIEEMKCNFYNDFLEHTFLNQEVLDQLVKYKKTADLYLVTKGSRERIVQLLNYHRCIDIFDRAFFCKPIPDKYNYVLEQIRCDPRRIVVFENDSEEILDAIKAGIPEQNITQVRI